MSDKLKKSVDWALENVPTLAVYERSAVEKIVKRALQETQLMRSVISVALSIGAAVAGGILHDQVRSSGGSQAEQYVVVLIAAVLGAAVGGIIGNELLRKRVQLLAGGL